MPRIVPLSDIIHPYLTRTIPRPEGPTCTRCQELAFTPPHPVWDETADLCLFHSKREDKAEEFKKAIDAMVEAGNCKFWGFVFPPGFSFRGSHLFPAGPLKDANFWGATFQGDANFLATFQGDASFWKATFQGNADFRRATFQEDARFWGATFQGNADFARATFQGDAYFSNATFPGDADFSEATFQAYAGFLTATFQAYAGFLTATFQAYAGFFKASFQGGAEFWGATFRDAGFSRATFQGYADFSEATFKEKADFRGGWIKGGGKEKQYELFSKESATEFLRVSFERPELVYFYRVNLSRCRFLDTDLKSVNFIGITEWYRKGWRKALCDEDHRDLKERLPELIELYRQLKQNHEERRDWETANHFHYGQMEMQRKEKGRPWRERILLNIYRVLSGYGVRYDWTLLWLFFLTLIFAAIYTYWLDGSMALGLKHAVRLMTLIPRETPRELAAPWWLTTLNSLTGASLIALLILALRRRFRF